MTDDGAAIAVAENLRSKLELAGLEVIIGETDFQYCFHLIDEDDFVILLDAEYTGDIPGSIHVYTLQEAILEFGETCSQHEMRLIDLMRLYPRPLRGYLIGIEIARADIGFELSEVLMNKFAAICLQVEGMIHEMVKESQNA